MKILHIIPSYLPAKFASGPILPTHYLNRELIKLGAEVTVYTTNLDGRKKMNVSLGGETDIDGVKVFYFDAEPFWTFSSSMKKAIAENLEKFDLVHITSVFLASSTLGTHYAKKINKPYIISPHGSFMEEPLKKSSLKKKIYISILEKSNLAGAAAIHFVADTEKEDYLKTKLPLNHSMVIPNGLDPKELGDMPEAYRFHKKFNISQNKKVVLFLARMNPIKGLDTLIPAFAAAAAKDSSVLLVLAGYDQDNYSSVVKELIEENKIADKVIFAGPLSGKDKFAAILESCIFILPSYSEACSMALIEAMHFSLPPIITEGVGFSGKIKEAGAGIVVPKNIKALEEAIITLLGDERAREDVGRKAAAFASKNFLISEVAKNFLAEYSAIINKYDR